ncbi:uracil-DNA glycosylase [Luteolibacter soli]|uniref:Type-4 uracil-DNA glycosylase n=1 Tax=Luteolibacter soli TaxID=3135280 RepID=A0ABU9ATK6_9BACT
MSRPVDALLDFLRSEEARGVTHIHLDDQAKELLRELHRRARAPKGDPARPASVVAETSTSAPDSTLASSAPQPTPAFVPAVSAPSGASAGEKIAALAAQAENWDPARKLGTLRTTMVFSTGNPEADLMLVGEAPGYQEELQREPFVGPAGQKLNDILKAMGLAREQAYISNIVKFRPATAGQTTNNRKPTLEEMASCLSFVRAEVEIVKPRCIVALGGTAAEGLLGLTGSVSAMRGKWYEFNGIPVRVTYHPSYLLRSTSVRDKRAVWEDMMEAMEKLDMPISERQRAFFQTK